MDQSHNVLRTTLSRAWLLKTGAFLLLLLGFGIWGTIDAYWAYPKRGLADASYQLRNWIAAADGAGKLTQTNFTLTDPKSELAALVAKQDQLRADARAEGSAGAAAKADLAKLEFLQSLSRLWQLNSQPKTVAHVEKPEFRTLIYRPESGTGLGIGPGKAQAELSIRTFGESLDSYWRTAKPPTPLSGFDMAFQYLFMFVGFVGGAWMIFVLLRAKATASKITWQHEHLELTLADGAKFTPATLKDIDKRDWHKYFCALIDADNKPHRVDLLRYEPLEDWVLQLERAAFPDRAKPADSSPEHAHQGVPETEPDQSPTT